VAAAIALPGLGVSAQETPGYRLRIVSPAEDARVFSDAGEVAARATVVPDLANGDRIELLVDGDPAGPPATSLDFRVSGMARGPHVLQARVIDSTGNVNAVSPSSIFYAYPRTLR
jgi:hypothetical protein